MRAILCTLLTTLCLAGAASAQVKSPLPLRVKYGNLSPSGNTRDLLGKQIPGIEVDIVAPQGAGKNYLSVGYFEKRAQGRRLRLIPVTAVSVSDSPLMMGTVGGFYTGSGLGAYFVEADGSGLKTRYGGFAVAGLRLGEGFFAEVKYHWVDGSVNGLSPNGTALLFGIRF